MTKWADYLIVKVLCSQPGLIDKVIARKDNGDTISSEEIEMTRYAITQHFAIGKSFATITKMPSGNWMKLNNVYHTRSFSSDYITIYSNPTRDDLGNIPRYDQKVCK